MFARRRGILPLVAAALAVMVSWGCDGGAAERPTPPGPTLTVSITGLAQGEAFPVRHTCDGEDLSPPVAWDGVPDGTVSFALVMEDPDAPVGTFTHWLLCDLTGSARELPEGIPPGETVRRPVSVVQGQNDFRTVGYRGPCPPRGRPHRYYLRLYAVDEQLDLPGGFSKPQLAAAMRDHVLATGELMHRYGRPGGE
jgi:Raf kinase inhibitor-like YbhB/YbcL family protein